MDYFALRHIVPELHPEAKPLIDGSRMLFHYQSEETAWQADDFYEPLTLPYGNTNALDNPFCVLVKHDGFLEAGQAEFDLLLQHVAL
ncbi:hypothetical protein ACFTAO_07815 [Paenibacillus rhizoplanae]